MDEMIEAVARALCTHDGKDPDGTTQLRGAPGFHPAGAQPSVPPMRLWQTYRQEAERFVVAAKALAPLLNRVDIGRW